MRLQGLRIKLSVALFIVAAISDLFFFQSMGETPGLVESDSSDTSLDTTSKEDDTTVIITSNYIPSHPSLKMIDRTIESLQHIQGLSKTTPIIITVDGAYHRDRGWDTPRNGILARYIVGLTEKYNEPHVTILLERTRIQLVGNVHKAMELVNTEFVYLIQHDMPFVAPVNHTALIQTFRSHPEEVRLVRFSPRRTLVRNRDKLGLCGTVGLLANGIELSKTHTWSDNNHLTRKSYYDEMFTTIQNWDGVRFMEEKMKVLGTANCSYWGTYLYGRVGYGPMIVHLDGRRETNIRNFVG